MVTTSRQEALKDVFHLRAKSVISSFPDKITALTVICERTKIETPSGGKRKRDDIDLNAEEHMPWQILAGKREMFLSDVDDLQLALTLHYLK
jgi:hypothetical protein